VGDFPPDTRLLVVAGPNDANMANYWTTGELAVEASGNSVSKQQAAPTEEWGLV